MLDNVSDIHFCVSDIGRSYYFPGPAKLAEELLAYAERVANIFLESNAVDSTVEFEKVFWRGHLDETVVDGKWVRFRKMAPRPPCLDSLPTPLPKDIRENLLDPHACLGGMILILGPTGSGKTTSASATVVSRLKQFKGFATTIEDPPEHPLNGWHGEGYCAQTWLKPDGETPWALAIKGALRSQPAKTRTMLMIGEVREDAAAAAAVLAASNGFLVVVTSHATSVESGVSAYANRLEDRDLELFIEQLRFVLFQRIVDDMLEVQLLKITDPIKQGVRKRLYSVITGELTIQQNQARAAAYFFGPSGGS